MKTRMIYIALLVMSFSSCIYTFHPLYSDDTLVDVPEIEGTFSMDDSRDDDPEIWTFTRVSKAEYNLEIMSGEKKGTLNVHTVKLGGELFMDILPKEYDCKQAPDFVNWHLIPVHTIAKLKIVDGNLHMILFDPVWLEKNLSAHRIRIAHEVRRNDLTSNEIDFILLTAGTKDLQGFVEKYARHADAFDDETVLTKIRVN